MKKKITLLLITILLSACSFFEPIHTSTSINYSNEESSEIVSNNIVISINDTSNKDESLESSEIINEETSILYSSLEESSEISIEESPKESSEEPILYEVNSSYFKCSNYETYQNNETYFLRVTFLCPVPVFKIDYQFEIYKNNGKLIEKTYDGELETTITSDGFSFVYPGIDYTTYTSCGYINFLEINGQSYSDVSSEPYTHNVTFHLNEEEAISSEVSSGDLIEEQEAPEINNIKFEGWYLDSRCQKKFDFEHYYIYQDIDLYPHYILNEEAFDQDVRTNFLTSNMVIYASSYNRTFFITTSESTSTGSGVVVGKQNGYTLILTNNHVVVKKSGYKYISYTVKDVYNSTYTASLFYSDPNYDLALIGIKSRQNKNYYVTPFAETNPEVGDYVAAIGEPNGEFNTITIGEIKKYKYVKLSQTTEEESNVTFEVISHSAETDHGSSGGALLDINLNLVGINYAGAVTLNTNEFIESYSIPIEKVNEFYTTALTYL